MEIGIRGTLSHVSSMGKGRKNLQTGICIKDSTQEESQTDMESITGQTVVISKAGLKMG